MQLQFVCEHCSKEFTARKTTTRFCSHNCARNSHRERTRSSKIEAAIEKRKEHHTPKPIDPKIEEVQRKEILSLKEAALLLQISSLTCRRWLKSGKMISSKLGKKHLIRRIDIDNLLHQSR